MAEINDFLTVYKDLEQVLRNKERLIGDGTVLSYENSLGQDDLEKLKLCRIIRNYCQHHADYKRFVAVSDGMIDFIDKQIAIVRKQDSLAKDIMKKLKVPSTKDTLNDVLKMMSKNKMDWCPILAEKPSKKVPVIAGIITKSLVIDLLAGETKLNAKLKTLLTNKTVQKELKNYLQIESTKPAKDLDISKGYIVVDANAYKGLIF